MHDDDAFLHMLWTTPSLRHSRVDWTAAEVQEIAIGLGKTISFDDAGRLLGRNAVAIADAMRDAGQAAIVSLLLGVSR